MIVWEWRTWYHLIQDHDPNMANYGDVAAHLELIDVNLNPSSSSDWMYSNGVAYNADLDQIVLSCRSFNELIVIDHSTTKAEAASDSGGRSGKGGDILYRWVIRRTIVQTPKRIKSCFCSMTSVGKEKECRDRGT